MNDDILRYSAFGAHYRLKLSQVIRFNSNDSYKFLATVCNQETHEKSLQTLDHILKYMEEEYDTEVRKEAPAMVFTVGLKRLEKNLFRVRAMRELMLQELDNFRIITEAEIQRRSRSYYRESHNKALSMLLNMHGINFPVFADMYMTGGTPITLVYAIDHDLIDQEPIMKRRRYEIDKERRQTD